MKIEINNLDIDNPLQTCMNGELVSNAAWDTFIGTACDVFSENYLNEYMFREQYINHVGFSIHTQETVDTLAFYLKNSKALEIGSGSGYLSYQLSKQGIDIDALDNESTHRFDKCYQRDITMDVMAYIKNNNDYTDIIMCWPYGSYPQEIIDLLKPGTNIWYLGEGAGGCCADESFFDMLDEKTTYLDLPSAKLNQHQKRFKGLHDYWSVYKKD